MKSMIAPMIVAALILPAAQAFADDSMQSDSMTAQHKQMMKDCMAKQKANNPSMSMGDMKQACKSEMKSKMEGGAMSENKGTGAMDSEGHPLSTPGSTPPQNTAPPK